VVVLAALAGCAGHHHGPRAHPDDLQHLYVEIAASGALADGVQQGLTALGFTVPLSLDRGGDVELEPGLVISQTRDTGKKRCTVKILVYRLPQHDLLGVADGAAFAEGASEDACASTLATALVRGKVATLLRRQLAEKR
jgi:hypothetical protein